MAKSIEASGLAQVRLDPLDAQSAVLVLTDTKQKSFGALINPDGLNALLAPLLVCASTWASKPDLKLETLVGPAQALPARRISFEKGRTPAECAVRIYLGHKMEMTFLMPLDEVTSAMANLARSITKDTPEQTEH
jgi:hypothetical protein